MATRKMHQTTVRFGSDLWEALDEECEHLGVSVAQYLREAALARLMYAAGERGDRRYDAAIATARANAAESTALWAQGRQARRRSRELRDESSRARSERGS
jgi:hypothetical protein